MANTDFELKRNDTSVRTFKLKKPDGTPFDPNADGGGVAGLSFFYELAATSPPGSSPTPGTGTFAIVDAPLGLVSYAFSAADTATEGVYRGEIESLGPSRETFPQDEWFLYEITPDLGQG